MVKVVVERELCDPCVHVDAVDDPHEVVAHHHIQVDGRGGKAGFCQLHDRLFEATILLAYRLQEQADAERTEEVAEVLVELEHRPPAEVEGPARVAKHETAAPPPLVAAEAVPPPRQEPIPSVEAEEPVQEEPTGPKYAKAVCVACREADLPAETYTMPYSRRRDHATSKLHRAAPYELAWEGDELSFPCTNLEHSHCQRTRFSFPTKAMARGHSDGSQAKSLKRARAIKLRVTQQELRDSGVPLVVCPLQHDIEEPFLVALENRSTHARTAHRLHAGEIEWVEHGTPLPLVCDSKTPHHKQCTGRMRFPDMDWLNNHRGFTGAAKEKMLQAGTLLPVE